MHELCTINAICTMKYNLLQKTYDLQCDLFIQGHINYDSFLIFESYYLMNYELFTISLN